MFIEKKLNVQTYIISELDYLSKKDRELYGNLYLEVVTDVELKCCYLYIYRDDVKLRVATLSITEGTDEEMLECAIVRVVDKDIIMQLDSLTSISYTNQ